MLICPICRSQNMDTAKFCGNCGNPFPRPSEPASSLINCPQGHIFSAVYQHCPYCPQPENSEVSTFATMVEEAVTPADQPSSVTAPNLPQIDYATRIDPGETMFETLESPPVLTPPVKAQGSEYAPTEVINNIPSIKSILETAKSTEAASAPATPLINFPSAESAGASSVEANVPTANSQPLRKKAPPPEGDVPPQELESSKQSESDRRTIVVAEQAGPERASKGKIVGWLITYNRNPDGDDYRVYAGYNRMGANPVCDIVIDDETVSGSHAIIVFRDGRCLIKDDLSRNGTFVNGREITEAHPLQNYDQIRMGNTYLTFVAAQRLV